MQLAVISDTHLHAVNPELENLYKRFMAGADVLIHLGDMVGEEVNSFFHQHPRFFNVRGNCDFGGWAGTVPATRSLELEGFTIGAAHGWGPRSLVWKSVADAFGPGYDFIFYGHTHKRDHRRIPGGPLIINPGSLTSPRDGLAGMAIIRLERGTLPDVAWVDVGQE